jgi:hypothetical protein
VQIGIKWRQKAGVFSRLTVVDNECCPHALLQHRADLLHKGQAGWTNLEPVHHLHPKTTHLYIKTIILPRQARDKQTDKEKKGNEAASTAFAPPPGLLPVMTTSLWPRSLPHPLPPR